MAVEAPIMLELYLYGQSAKSNAALELVRRICEQHLGGNYHLEIIDIHLEPQRVAQAGVVATPALVRRHPEPIRRTVGRFTDERVREGIGIDAP